MDLTRGEVVRPFEVVVCYREKLCIALKYSSVEPKELTIVGSCCLRKDGSYEKTRSGYSKRTIGKSGIEIPFFTKRPSEEYTSLKVIVKDETMNKQYIQDTRLIGQRYTRFKEVPYEAKYSPCDSVNDEKGGVKREN